MPIVELSEKINAPIDRVIEIAKDIERYPEFMPEVESISIIEKADEGKRVKSKWVGKIPQFGMKVKWTQQDEWDMSVPCVHFRQVEGDYDKMEGRWEFRTIDGMTEIYNYLDYEYNVPLLGALLQKVVLHIVTSNIRNTLLAIKQKAES
jgi:coenzyme Q-binding protein COQ10